MTKIRLINDNSIDYMKTLDDESLDLIITDPPIKSQQEEMQVIVVE